MAPRRWTVTLGKSGRPARSRRVPPAGRPDGHGPTLAEGVRAGYLGALAGRYRLLDLATLAPEAVDEQVSVQLAQVFVPPQVRAEPPDVELPRELWRRLIECGELGADELPTQVDRELLARARQAHLDQPAQPVLTMLGGPHRLVALLGDPGAGKSSLLRYLALALATGDLPPELAGWAGWLPILVELRAYADPTWATGRWADGTLLDYLDYLHQEGVGLPHDVLDRFLREDGRAVVMFDGLDELFDPTQRDATARRIAGFAARYPRMQVIVTSRPIGYRRSILDAAGFALYALQDLDRDQIATFVHTWYRIAYRATPPTPTPAPPDCSPRSTAPRRWPTWRPTRCC